MPKTLGKFDHETTKMGKGDSIPFKPFVLLCLKSYGSTTRDGSPLISDKLMSDNEIDECVRLLKADLDEVALKAKHHLQVAAEQTLDALDQRAAK